MKKTSKKAAPATANNQHLVLEFALRTISSFIGALLGHALWMMLDRRKAQKAQKAEPEADEAAAPEE